MLYKKKKKYNSKDVCIIWTHSMILQPFCCVKWSDMHFNEYMKSAISTMCTLCESDHANYKSYLVYKEQQHKFPR